MVLICAIYSFAFGIFHMFFWKFFKWKRDLRNLTKVNEGIMQILNIQIIFYFFFVSFVCFYFNQDLVKSELGLIFLAGNSIFWIIRFINQFLFLRFNDYRIHILSVVFFLGAVIFAIPVIQNL